MEIRIILCISPPVHALGNYRTGYLTITKVCMIYRCKDPVLRPYAVIMPDHWLTYTGSYPGPYGALILKVKTCLQLDIYIVRHM